MFFRIKKKSKKSRARLGVLSTVHGDIETPAFIPVATRAAVKGLTVEQLNNLNIQAVLCNAYHLYLRPGDQLIKKNGGLHQFMNWPKPIFTDSGGYQVFSLGAGLKEGVGKIGNRSDEQFIENQTNSSRSSTASLEKNRIKETFKIQGTGESSKPSVFITEDGVEFRSHIDGSRHFLTPEKSIQIQKNLGADIIFAFDECTSPLHPYEYVKKAMKRTHRWAERSLNEFKKRAKKLEIKNKKSGRQFLLGIVQGGEFEDLRKTSAKFIGQMDFDGFGIGGSFGGYEKGITDALDWTISLLPEEKPVHLLGIGRVEDIYRSVAKGIDTFDCVIPTRLGRHGGAMLKKETLNLKSGKFLKDFGSIDKKCFCFTCQNHSRAYLSHLFRSGEILGATLATTHNLYFMEELMKEIRKKI